MGIDIDKELEKLFEDPIFDVSEKEASLFDIPVDMKKVMEKRNSSEHVAQRKPCEDFDLYKPLFEQVRRELNEGKRRVVRMKKIDEFLTEGHFYSIDGMLLYIQRIEKLTRDSNGRGKNKDARTRCIYENGTESDILAQSLRRSIYADGYGITDPQEAVDAFFAESLGSDDLSTGYLYVLKSLSSNPEIAGVKDLYKIGFSTNKVEERIKNAANEPTYLMAPVQIIDTYEIVNMNSHKFETIVHQVFNAAQFQLKVYDDNGNVHVPSEWYVVPREIISDVVAKITDGTIIHYVYNPQLQCLEQISSKSKFRFSTKGLKVLKLKKNKAIFDEIVSGKKTIESCELNQKSMNKFTYVDKADGKRYLCRYDVLSIETNAHCSRESALIEIVDIEHNGNIVYFTLGCVLEHIPGA